MTARAGGAFVTVLVAGSLLATGDAAAIEPPPELAHVCVDRRDDVHQAVDPAQCKRDERAVALPEDRPFHVCAELKFGWLRAAATPWSCATAERPLTVPDSGAIYVCADNLQGGRVLPRGRLRRVDDVAGCEPRAETGFVTPAAPTAVADHYSTSEDALLDVPAKGVLANDVDLTGAPLGATLDTGTAVGVLALRRDGAFSFDPRGRFDALDRGESADEPFSYVADDGALASAAATATVTIVGRNDAPLARDDSFRTDEDSPLQVAAPGVLSNDHDPEDHPLAAILVADVAAGALSLGSDGSVAFDPAGEFQSLSAGEHALVSFTYLARDGSADSTAAVGTILVDGRDDAEGAQP